MAVKPVAAVDEKYYTDSSMDRFNRGGTQSPYLDHMPPSPCSTLRQPDTQEEGLEAEGKSTGPTKPIENAPKPPPQLSPSAIDKRLRRVMTPRACGTLKVPQEVVDQWRDPGTRPKVFAMFEKVGYDSDRVVQTKCFLK